MLPPVEISDLNGNAVGVPAVFNGKVAAILFWAEGCSYCEKGMPELEELYNKYKDKGYIFIAVQTAGSKEAGGRLQSEFKLTFPMLTDIERKTIKKYRIVGVPSMYIVTRDGRVKEKILGGLDAGELEKLIMENL